MFGLPRSLRMPSGAIALLLAACTSAAQAAPYVMFRDPDCGCCKAWAEHIHNGMKAEIVVREDVPMPEVKAAMGVPANLVSCHTMEI